MTFFPTDQSIGPAEMAAAAEARGFESVWFAEHSHMPMSLATPGPPEPGQPGLPREYYAVGDPFVGLAMAAAVTMAQRNKRGALMILLSLTLAGALTFLVIKYFEYTHKFHEGWYPGMKFYEKPGEHAHTWVEQPDEPHGEAAEPEPPPMDRMLADRPPVEPSMSSEFTYWQPFHRRTWSGSKRKPFTVRLVWATRRSWCSSSSPCSWTHWPGHAPSSGSGGLQKTPTALTKGGREAAIR